MFKQPAENTNATPIEERRTAERMNPQVNEADEYAEIEAEAKRLASERDGAGSYSDEEWEHASRIVRNRNISIRKA